MRTAEPGTPASEELREALRRELLRLARLEEDLATREAERLHYWESVPVTVSIHRQCAAALRAAADEHLSPAGLPNSGDP